MKNTKLASAKKIAGVSLLPALVAFLMLGALAAAPATPSVPEQPTVVATADAGTLNVTWFTSEGADFYTVGWANYDEALQMVNAGRDWLDAFHFATIPAQYTSHLIQGLQPGVEYYVIIGARTARYGGDPPVWSPWSDLVATSEAPASDCVADGTCIPVVGLGTYSGNGDSTAHAFDLASGLHRMTLTGDSRASADLVSTEVGRDIFYFDFVSTGDTRSEELITVRDDDAGTYLLEIDAGDQTAWTFTVERIGQ